MKKFVFGTFVVFVKNLNLEMRDIACKFLFVIIMSIKHYER